MNYKAANWRATTAPGSAALTATAPIDHCPGFGISAADYSAKAAFHESDAVSIEASLARTGTLDGRQTVVVPKNLELRKTFGM